MVVRFAIIGAGTIGKVHARNILHHPNCQLLWVVDQAEDRADAFAREFGGKTARSAEEVLADPQLDAVVISSSTSAHRDHLLACLRAAKPVLCEKPIADNLADAKACADLATKAGVTAAVGFNRRLDRNYRAVHDRIRAGRIGNVELLHFVSRGPLPPKPETVQFSGGMIREKGSHFFDLAYWMAGAEPVEAFASGACLIDPDFAKYDDVDTAALTLRFASGAMATFSFSRRTTYGYEESLEVFGSKGMLESRRQRDLGIALYADGQILEEGLHANWYDRFAVTYRLELDAFVEAMKSKMPAPASLRDGLRAQAVAEAMVRSVKSGTAVKIEQIW